MFLKLKTINLLLFLSITSSIFAQEISSFVKVGTNSKSISELTKEIKNNLNDKGFIFLGDYKPENKSKFRVLTFTRKDLMNVCLKVKDRGALASVLKIGLHKKNNETEITYVNPTYIFNAYLKESATTYKFALDKIVADFTESLSSIGNEFTEFGGKQTVKKLRKYHYMMGMPYFNDPVKLKEFSSFEEGVKTIKKNLNAKKNNTVKVYEIIFNNKKIAVFGVGLHDLEKGEGKFLPIIGEDHIAAMPYEIILQGNKATMLHGRYRIALHWPELKMGTFMKIMSTPGDIKDALKSITE